MIFTNTATEALLDGLCNQGYVICEAFLPAPHVQSLADIAQNRYANHQMQHAKIGKTNIGIHQEIRGDATCWLDENDANPSIQTYFEHMHALKQYINQSLFMNLHTLETHMAVYPVGNVYKKHLDQFATGENTRALSSIVYLNAGWQAEDGGELRLYLDDGYIDILPTGGKLVLFLSSKFWHEVLPAKRPRISLTGWFHTPKQVMILG